MEKFYILITAAIIIVMFLVPIPKFMEYDFYEFHVAEAEAAHAQNMSCNVWSGSWYEPSERDLEIPWVIHPSEDPRAEIPHGSNLGSGEHRWVLGIFGYLTSPFYLDDKSNLDNTITYSYPNGTVTTEPA